MAKFIKLESGRIINTDMIVSVVGATNDKYSHQISMANGKYYLISRRDALRLENIIGLELGNNNEIKKMVIEPVMKVEEIDGKLRDLERNLNTLNFEEMGCDTMGCINQMKPSLAKARKEIEEYKRGRRG